MAVCRAVNAMKNVAPSQQGPTEYSRLGPIGPLMANPRVSEIMVMGAKGAIKIVMRDGSVHETITARPAEFLLSI